MKELFRPKFLGAITIDGARHDYWHGCAEPDTNTIELVDEDGDLTYHGHGGLDQIIVEISAMIDGGSDPRGLAGTTVPLMAIIRDDAYFDANEYDITITVDGW